MLSAQVYVDGANTRHRFAQLNLGVDTRVFVGENTSYFTFENGVIKENSFSPVTETRLIIGGTHFWGHADFYIAIPILNFGNEGFFTTVETGGRYYPWRVEVNKIRPYVGLGFNPHGYKKGEGATWYRTKLTSSLGITTQLKSLLISADVGYVPNNSLSYYSEVNSIQPVQLPHLFFSTGIKWSFDTTLGAEEDWESGRTALLTDTLAKLKRLNGFTIGLGASSSFFIGESNYNAENYPFLDEHFGSGVFPEFGLGYYWHQPDLQVNIAYRKYSSALRGFDYSQLLERKAINLEVFKFLGDYHGFAPFIGPAVSYENIAYRMSYQNNSIDASNTSSFQAGITFGWDIRPNRLQAFILRTNLRYFPWLNTELSNGESFKMAQLEFNFIQLVIFPGRLF